MVSPPRDSQIRGGCLLPGQGDAVVGALRKEAPKPLMRVCLRPVSELLFI
jgi:hypothetical protein